MLNWKDPQSVCNAVLELVPQRPPFRFLDRIVEVDEQKIVGEYTFRPDESFYAGHFPGMPVTPGVILIEAMAQTGVVALGIYLMLADACCGGADETKKYVTFFTDCEAEFLHEVKPGDRVIIKAERVFWRRRKLRARATLHLADGTLAATANLSGMGVER